MQKGVLIGLITGGVVLIGGFGVLLFSSGSSSSHQKPTKTTTSSAISSTTTKTSSSTKPQDNSSDYTKNPAQIRFQSHKPVTKVTTTTKPKQTTTKQHHPAHHHMTTHHHTEKDKYAPFMHAANNQPVLQPTYHHQIYYRIVTKRHNRFYHVWKVALWHWNQLHVIKFVPTYRHNHHPVITLKGNYNYRYIQQKRRQALNDLKHHITQYGGIQEVGHASMNYIIKTGFKHPYFHHNYAQLDVTASAVSYQHQVVTAEHELGHILGFLHQAPNDNNIGKSHVMAPVQPTNIKDIIPLGKEEQKTLQHYYH